MPAARGEAAENRAASRLAVEMERLRIQFSREALDPRLVHAQAARAVGLAGGEVLEVFTAHRRSAVSTLSNRRCIPPETSAIAPLRKNVGVARAPLFAPLSMSSRTRCRYTVSAISAS